MRAKLALQLLGLTAIVGLPLGTQLVRSHREVDACLDRGGCFDYRAWVCEHDDRSRCDGPIALLPPDRRWLPGITIGAWLVGAGGLVLGSSRGRRQRPSPAGVAPPHAGATPPG